MSSTIPGLNHDCPDCRCQQRAEVKAMTDWMFKGWFTCSRCKEFHSPKYPDEHGKCPKHYPDIY